MKEITVKTRNLYEAAFLYAKESSNFIGLEEDGRDCIFIFKPGCRALVDKYYNRDIEVNAKDYADSIRTLKYMIFNRLRERRNSYGNS